MPVVDTTMQGESLRAMFGLERATHMPDTYDLELWDGDPRDDGSAELAADGGYAAVSVDADDFDLADDGVRMLGPLVTGTATDEFSDTATHYVLRHPTTSGIAFCAPLDEPLSVTGAGDWSVRPILYFADPE